MLQDKNSTKLKNRQSSESDVCSPTAAFGEPQEFVHNKTEITD